MRSLLTIVMPTSPIPSHPSTEVIEESIQRLREYPELEDCEILIQIDGIREEQKHREADYEEYKRRLLWLCAHEMDNCLPIVFDEHTHQAGMLRATLDRIRTPLMMYVEADTFPLGEVPWSGICQAILNNPDMVKQVRLHIFDSVLKEHLYLIETKAEWIEGVPMLKTIQWSQRPHICSVEYYRWIIEDHFGINALTMIEDVLFGTIYHQNADGKCGHEKYGLWIYCPDGRTDAGMLRSGTTDGRKNDPKYKMRFEYPDDIPYAAPTNR